jgi:hypothetical protein
MNPLKKRGIDAATIRKKPKPEKLALTLDCLIQKTKAKETKGTYRKEISMEMPETKIDKIG